jgi:CO dehydrogenase maturation factor
MKVAFVGKGGSGKTTLASLLSRHLAAQGAPVLAIDADINQHLAVALGLGHAEAARLPALGERQHAIKEWLRGSNPRIASAEVMVKTTPPGRGSRLLRLDEPNPIFDELERAVGGVRLLVTGGFDEADLGVACYHSKTGAVELLLGHLVDGPGEYVVVDMTAGADCFASGLFAKFDITLLVCEPTLKGVAVHRQFKGYAADHRVDLRVVGNRVHDAEEVGFLRREVGDDLLVCAPQSAAVRAMERGAVLPLESLEPEMAGALEEMRRAIDATTQDWESFQRDAVALHVRNALSWANTQVGTDLTLQVDPDFTLPPPRGAGGGTGTETPPAGEQSAPRKELPCPSM